MKRLPLFLLVVMLLPMLLPIPRTVSAQVYKTESGHAEFHSEVPLHTFSGSSEFLVGLINLSDSTVDFYLDLTTLDTGIDKRDKDMRRTLETDKYPFASFYGKLISDFNPNLSEPQTVRVRGDFKIHGVERQVTLEGTLQKTGEGLEVSTTWTLDLDDYDIEPPGILFYRVDEEQDIRINAHLTPTETN